MLGLARLLRFSPHIHSAQTGRYLQNLFPISLFASPPSSSPNPGQSSYQHERVVISTTILFKDSIRGSLRSLQSRQALCKFTSDAICSKNQSEFAKSLSALEA